MPAYCYFDILKVHDEKAMQSYKEKVLQTIDLYGGRYLIIAGPFETKEGNFMPTFPMLIEFKSLDTADHWYNSEEYNELKSIRQNAVESNVVFFQGI